MVSGEYKPFDVLTRNALYHAAAERGLEPPPTETMDALMRSYDALRVFPEVPGALELLRRNDVAVEAYVFSNGTASMVGNSVRNSPDLGPHAVGFQALVTVDEVRCYKPDRRVYEHLVEQTSRKGVESSVWVVSANPFDIVGARAAGLNAAFIDRSGKGWIDRLDEVRVPTIVVKGLDDAVSSILDIL